MARALGMQPTTFLDTWQNTVADKATEDKDSLVAEWLYRAPAALASACPHTRALLKYDPDAGAEGLGVLWRHPAAWQAWQTPLAWLLERDPKNRYWQLVQLRQQAAGLAWDKPAGEWQGLLAAINQQHRRPPTHLEDVELGVLRSDVLALSDLKQSLEALEDVAKLQQHHNLGAGLRRKIHARLGVSQWPANWQRPWRRYLAGWGPLPKPLASGASQPWLEQYLRLRSGGDPHWQELTTLTAALARPLPPGWPETFYSEWYAHLARGLMAQRAFAQAATAWKRCANWEESGAQAHRQQLARLSAWYAANSHGAASAEG